MIMKVFIPCVHVALQIQLNVCRLALQLWALSVR